MNIGQARVKLDSISKSTATKHPKVLVAELCSVVKFLLDEIDRIKTPILSVLPQRLLEGSEPKSPQTTPYNPTSNSLQPHGKGDVGDAE